MKIIVIKYIHIYIFSLYNKPVTTGVFCKLIRKVCFTAAPGEVRGLYLYFSLKHNYVKMAESKELKLGEIIHG